jgi:AcrR family transcriptional regulator
VQSVIQQHIENVEYAKQMARELAGNAVEQLDLRDVLSNDAERIIEILLAGMLLLLGPYVHDVASEAATYAKDLGLAELSDADIEDVVSQQQNNFVEAARPALAIAIATAIARIHDAMQAGVSEEAIQLSINTDETAGALLAPVAGALRKYAATFIQGVERGVNNVALDSFQTPGDGAELGSVAVASSNLVWIAVQDANTCVGNFAHACEPRHGTVASIEKWTKDGPPGSPVLLCSMFSPRHASRCRCVLADPKHALAIPSPVKAGEAVKRGKDRAKALSR